MFYVGIDLGGTGIKAGVVDADGQIICKRSCPTLVERGYQPIIQDMASLVFQVVEQSGHTMDEIEAVGIGIPGINDPKTGIVHRCPNLNWFRVPLVEEMKRLVGKPIIVENDATVAAMAESVSGASAGIANSVFVTLGTGIGAGIIINGKIYSGSHGVGSEIGHTIMNMDGIPCSCGNAGCIDHYCSASSLIRIAAEAAAKCPESKLNQTVPLDAKVIMEIVQQGDPTAVAVFDEYTTYLSIAMVNIVNFLDPEVIVLGGGVSGAGEFLLEPVRQKLAKIALIKDLPHAELRISTLGNDAGIIGAAMLGRN